MRTKLSKSEKRGRKVPKVTGKTYEVGDFVNGLTVRTQVDGRYELCLFSGDSSICDVSRIELSQITDALKDFLETVEDE